MNKFKKIVFFLSVFSLAFEINVFQIGGFGFKPWMIAALAGGILLLADLYKEGFDWLKKSKIFWLGLGFFVFSALGLINSPLIGFSFKQLIVLVALIILGVYFEKNIRNNLDFLYFALFGGMIANSIYAIYQNIAFNNGWPNFEIMAARPNGFFPEPDWLGFYLALGLVPFLIWIGKDLKKSTLPKRFQNNYIFYSFVFVVITALIITVARASWLAIIAEVGIIVMTQILLIFVIPAQAAEPKNDRARLLLKTVSIFVFTTLVSLLLINIFHLSRFDIADRFRSIFFKEHAITVAVNPSTGEKIKIDLETIDSYRTRGYQIQEDYVGDENVASREEKFTGAWDMIKNHPLLGSGLGITLINTNYEHNANNLFLEWWASAGIGALLTILSLIIYLLLKGLSFLKNNPEKAALILAGTIGFVILNTFNASIFLAFAWFYLAWLFKLSSLRVNK